MSTTPVYLDIMTLIQDGGLGTIETDLFGGEWGSNGSSQIHEQILALSSDGVPSELKELYEQPGFQIITRGKKRGLDSVAYTKAKIIGDLILSQSESVEINGVCYRGFEEVGGLIALGKDDNERFSYSQNFTTYRNR